MKASEKLSRAGAILGQGGSVGGRARAAKLSPRRRQEIAKWAALARWARKRGGCLAVSAEHLGGDVAQAVRQAGGVAAPSKPGRTDRHEPNSAFMTATIVYRGKTWLFRRDPGQLTFTCYPPGTDGPKVTRIGPRRISEKGFIAFWSRATNTEPALLAGD